MPPPHDIAEMHLHSTGTSWDKMQAPDATMSDVDPEKIKRYIRQSRDAGRRDEVWDYPLEAILESIINAVCHRDYTMPSNTEVRLYI